MGSENQLTVPSKADLTPVYPRRVPRGRGWLRRRGMRSTSRNAAAVLSIFLAGACLCAAMAAEAGGRFSSAGENGTGGAPDGEATRPAAGLSEAGGWVFTAFGAAAFEVNDKGDLYGTHFGVGYFLLDSLAVHGDGILTYVDMDDDAAGAGLEFALRWHFVRREGWTAYLDGGLGVLYTSGRFPEDGTRFNFMESAGAGLSRRIATRLWLTGGARWLHISNANLGDGKNPGFDGFRVSVGVSTPL
jgi:hypothetical protein